LTHAEASETFTELAWRFAFFFVFFVCFSGVLLVFIFFIEKLFICLYSFVYVFLFKYF
jgi:hypothetical protein